MDHFSINMKYVLYLALEHVYIILYFVFL